MTDKDIKELHGLLTNRSDNGYPTEEFLEWIRNYDIINGSGFEYLQVILSEWWPYEDGAYTIQRKYRGERKVYVHTWGWSGNESMIAAMQENKHLFWTVHYFAHQRGGHYTFVFTNEMH